MKPLFTEAAEKVAEDERVGFAAVDCTTETSLCNEYEVKVKKIFDKIFS